MKADKITAEQALHLGAMLAREVLAWGFTVDQANELTSSHSGFWDYVEMAMHEKLPKENRVPVLNPIVEWEPIHRIDLFGFKGWAPWQVRSLVPMAFDVSKLKLETLEKGDAEDLPLKKLYEKIVHRRPRVSLGYCLGYEELVAIQNRGDRFFRRHLGDDTALLAWRSVYLDETEALIVPLLKSSKIHHKPVLSSVRLSDKDSLVKAHPDARRYVTPWRLN